MIIQRINNPAGIDDIKLIGENDAERSFIQQLAEAGTLISTTTMSSGIATFRAMPISMLTNDSTLLNRGKVGQVNFNVRQNQDYIFGLRFVSNDLPMVLNDFTAIKMQIKNNKSSSAIITLSVGSGLEITGDDDNILQITLTSAQTALLCNQEYYHDILFETGTGAKMYYIEGLIKVDRSVTS
jgi:hypothetical protein